MTSILMHRDVGPVRAPLAQRPQRRDAKEVQEVWTDEVVLVLRQLAGEGDKSASGIALTLNERFDFKVPLSRSAVIGKCYRTGIPLQGKTAPVEAKEVKLPERRPAVAPVVVEEATPTAAMFEVPVGPIPVSLPLSRDSRANLSAAAQAYDRYHQTVLDWMEARDDLVEGEEVPARPGAPLATIPYWAGNDPVSLLDATPRSCRYVTCRSKGQNLGYYCGDPVEGGSFCTWHARLSHTGTN